MKKVIVIGATGQLGCYSALHLADLSYQVIAVGHRSSDNGFFATRKIKYIGNFSLEKEESFKLLPTDVDAVVHLAGAMPAHAGVSPMPYVQSIVVGMVNLCEWMKNTKCRRIVFNTTPSDVCKFFGTDVPVNDDAPRSFPKDGGDHAIYAISKNTAVDILEHYGIAYGIKSCIFRHLTVYGFQPNPYYVLNGEKKILPWRLLMKQAMAGQTIDIWGNPDFKKELLYIKDFTQAVGLAVNNTVTGIFNLSGDRPYTMKEQVCCLVDVFCEPGHISQITYSPEKKSTPQNLLNSQRARTILGWHPQYDWWKACEDMKQEMKLQPISLLWGKSEDFE